MGFFDVKFTDLIAAHQRDKIKEANEEALYELEKQTREIQKASEQATYDQALLRNQMYVSEQDSDYNPSVTYYDGGILPADYNPQIDDDERYFLNVADNYQSPNHLETLKIRLAKGEITVDEYKKIKMALES